VKGWGSRNGGLQPPTGRLQSAHPWGVKGRMGLKERRFATADWALAKRPSVGVNGRMGLKERRFATADWALAKRPSLSLVWNCGGVGLFLRA